MILAKRAPVAEGGLQAGVSKANLMGAWATFRGSRGSYTVVGAHYTWPVPAGPQQQQTLRLARVLETFPKESLIVTGDFNSTPWSFSLRRQDRLFGLERRTRALFTLHCALCTVHLALCTLHCAVCIVHCHCHSMKSTTET
jgi:endonuclease/exonuclease/phosphatase (EEP) superfamily protein YafD